MKFKVSIISPVHIATGENIPPYCYFEKNNKIHKVDIEEIIGSGQIPVKELMKLRFSNSDDNSKKYICDFFERRLNYNRLSSSYQLEGDLVDYLDVSEQMKSMNKPYIPGSSIKGALLNSITYYLLENNKEDINRFLKQSRINPKYFEKELFSYVLGKDYEDTLKLFSSCLIVRDIYFDRMMLCSAQRLNMNEGNQKKGNSFNHAECIAYSQTITDEVIEINQNAKDLLKRRIDGIKDENLKKRTKVLLAFLSADNLLIGLRRFFKSMIMEEKAFYQNRVDHECQADIQRFINNLDITNKECAYLKIGNSTNYFFKTVSLFFKNNFEDFYSKNFEIFSPVKLDKEGRAIPKPDSMPKTRVVFRFKDTYYLPGVIRFEKCD